MLQNPAFLWALSGLLIPLAIHLWNRKKGKVKYIGSIKWLIASQNKRSDAIQLNEILKWVLRSLILLLFTGILADFSLPSNHNEDDKKSDWVGIHPFLLKDSLVLNQVKEMIRKGEQVHLLSKGFPLLDTNTKAQQLKIQDNIEINYWSYIKELSYSDNPPQKIQLITDNYSKNFKGKRPVLPLEVEWIILPAKNKNFFVAQAEFIPKSDSIKVQIGINEETGTWFRTVLIPKKSTVKLPDFPEMVMKNDSISIQNTNPVKIKSPASKKILILYEKDFEGDVDLLESAFKAINLYTGIQLDIQKKIALTKEDLPEMKFDYIFFLSKKDFLPQDYLPNHCIFVIYKEISSSSLIISNPDKKNEYFITKRLQPRLNTDILKGELPVDILLNVLKDSMAVDYIQRSEKLALSNSQLEIKNRIEENDIEVINREGFVESYQFQLWLLLIGIFILERWLSYRKQ